MRLTEKHWRNLDPWECCGQDRYCQRDCHGEGGCTNGCIVPKIYCRLAKYEDAESAGLLVMPPVKAGDVIYQLRSKKHALGVGVSPRHVHCVMVWGTDWSVCHSGQEDCRKKDFGKTWFLTKEEAEAALAKGGTT